MGKTDDLPRDMAWLNIKLMQSIGGEQPGDMVCADGNPHPPAVAAALARQGGRRRAYPPGRWMDLARVSGLTKENARKIE